MEANGNINDIMVVEMQNEYLAAKRNGKTVAIVPDLICILDAETAEPITGERLKYGQRVKVIGLSAAAILHFGIAYPLILLMLAVVSIHSGERNFINIMTGIGLGVAGLVVLIFATWTTNTGNLYSNSLVLKTIFTGVPQWLIVIAAGLLGTLLAIFGVSHFSLIF